MNMDRLVFAIAGIFVLSIVVLSLWHNPNWLWFTGFVGANLFQAGFQAFALWPKSSRLSAWFQVQHSSKMVDGK